MDVPETVRTALEDRAVAGRQCLEAGAGVGNTSAGLLEAGAEAVTAVTDDPDHAETVRHRLADPRLTVVLADLRSTPLADESVDLVTAHALCNVVPAGELAAIAAELTRVAAPDAQLVVDDYTPMPDSPVAELFAVENALSELAHGRPALTFYPADHLRRVFAGYGWTLDRRRTLLDPVPWTDSHLQAHLDVARDLAEDLPEPVADPLVGRAERVVADVDSVDAGEMYSLAFRR